MLDVKYFAGSSVGYTLPVGICENKIINSIKKLLLLREEKVKITIDDIRLKTNLATNKTIKLTKKPFFCTLLGFTKCHSRPLGDVEGFVQLIPGSYKSDEPINITGIDKFHLKGDCADSSLVNGIREPILYSLALDKPPGREIYKKPRNKLFKEINKTVLSHIMFYIEDDDYKPIDLNSELKSFTCQPIEI